MIHRGNKRHVLGGIVAAAVVAAGVVSIHASMAGASDPCARHRAESAERARATTGSGPRTVVIGDSWSVGMGIEDLADSWPSRLPGQVSVAGFSGSGFSRTASSCPGVSFAERAGRALRGGADLVVVQGGLNDYDQSDVAIERGFGQLVSAVGARHLVVVGPAAAPRRARDVPRVDRLLARLTSAYDVPYVATTDLRPDYLPDRLHLTAAGHAAFGDAVAERIARTR